MNNIKIRDIEVYHGSKVVNNSYYIEHFKKIRQRYQTLFRRCYWQKKRYVLEDKNENSLTMAINASNKVLEKSGLKGNDLDMIVYSSVLPEFAASPSSVILHRELHGKPAYSLGIYIDKICSKYCKNKTIVFAEDGRRFLYKKLSYQVNMIAKCLIYLGIKKEIILQ